MSQDVNERAMMSSRCAGHPYCRARCGQDQVACKQHWFMLPKPLRTAIWRYYWSDPGSTQHLAAIARAAEFLHEKLKPKAVAP